MSQKWTFYILRYIWGKKIHNSQWVYNEFSLRTVQMKIQHMHSFANDLINTNCVGGLVPAQ